MLTIHNLAFQGHFPASLFPRLGLPDRLFSVDGLEFWGGVNYLKGGLQYADRLDHGVADLRAGDHHAGARRRIGWRAAPAPRC